MKDITKPYNPLDSITKNPEWIAVENIIQQQIAKLCDVTDIDLKLTAEELKIELRARFLAQEKLEDFYQEYKFTTKKIEEDRVPFK